MIAVYRCLYGSDFVQESIRSILPHVDWVLVLLAPRPWGSSKGVYWKGEWVPWPAKFDDLRERVLAMPEAQGLARNVHVFDDFYPTPFGQYQHIVDDVFVRWSSRPLNPLRSDCNVVFIEPDHVFTEEQAAATFAEWHECGYDAATTRQVELWAPPGYKPTWRVPERLGRASVEFHRDCRPGKKLAQPKQLQGTVHNFGFCFSEQTMRWKHLTAVAFAAEIGDNPPEQSWFEEKWLKWHPETNNRDLEIAAGLGYKIPRVVPYDAAQLPTSMRARYGL